MTIKFNGSSMPNNEELLEQAAGAGIELVPGSLQEFRFLGFCYELWIHGADTGMDRYRKILDERADSRANTIEG